MKLAHLELRCRLCVFLLGFENLNMYAKATYLLRLEATVGSASCSVSRASQQEEESLLGTHDPLQQHSKTFMIRFQNEKVDLSDLFLVQTPLFKLSSESAVQMRLTLLKVEGTGQVRVASSSVVLRFPLGSCLEYVECTFQEPYLSSVWVGVLGQPSRVVVETQRYKHAGEEEIGVVRKEVKRLRYNNYLMQNKLKKMLYSDAHFRFTLPKMFVTGGTDMAETDSSEDKFLNYLLLYEQLALTPEIMNYELTSICHSNLALEHAFRQACIAGTVFTSKLRMESQEKEAKRLRQYITRELHKPKFAQDYKPILKEKLKLLEKEVKLVTSDETLNNITVSSHFHPNDPPAELTAIPAYPIVLHEVERLKEAPEGEQRAHVRYIFLLAHGYQGCPQDLVYIANGLKRKFRKSKYLILKSYQGMMDKSLADMGAAAAEEARAYLGGLKWEEKEYRVVMVGHSMGGLVLRCVAASLAGAFGERLHGLVTLGTPHLGYLQGVKLLIKAGMSLLSNVSSSQCMGELSLQDRPNLHECLLYRLSAEAPMGMFRKVALLSSVHDKYVPWHSARLEPYSRDALKQPNFLEHEMIQNIIGKDVCTEAIHRIEVHFQSHQTGLDSIIGRSAHIKFLNDHYFIDLFIAACLKPILED